MPLIGTEESIGSAVLLLVGLGFLGYYGHRWRLARELKARGISVIGTVSVTRRASSQGGGLAVVGYQDQSGERHNMIVHLSTASRGTEATVWYDPERPERAVIPDLQRRFRRMMLGFGLMTAIPGVIGLVLTVVEAVS